MSGAADSELRVEVHADADAAARRGAELIAEHARAAVAERDGFSLAISGGHSPWPMFERLAADPSMPLAETDLFQVDERVAPDGHPDRNWTHAERSLPLDRFCSVWPMPVTDPDLDMAAIRYESLMPHPIDLVHLGLGPDGHTASLVPGDPVCEVDNDLVAMTASEYQGRRRMTLTYPALAAARQIVWLVLGEKARDALARLREGDPSIPGGRVERERALVLTDRAAAPEG